tara:strand:+ start:108 stop:836 length:729 start_codon:yes stop_codon:yes gene_type:complete
MFDVEKLKDDAHYYGAYGRKYLSNSDISALLTCPTAYGKPSEQTKPMLIGSYLHTHILEPEKVKNFEVIDVASRNTKVYKEALANSTEKMILLNSEAEEVKSLVKVIKGNLPFYEAIYNESNQFEVPAVQNIHGELWKGKADVVCENMLIDLKTTSSMKDFKWSAKKYNYDSQCYIYQSLFGKPLVFYVIDKVSHQLGIFHASQDFLMRGKAKVEEAVEVYQKFFKEGSLEDIETYLHTEIL